MLIKSTASLLIAALILLPVFSTKSIGQLADSRQAVVWTGIVNCAVAGSAIEKTSGRTDTSDGGARSQQQITSGDASVEFTAGVSNKLFFVGLARNAIGFDFVGLDYCIKFTELGFAEVRENNDYKIETTYRVGDVFRISIDGGVVRYYKNDGFIYSSRKLPAYPLTLHAMFLDVGSKIENVSIGALAIGAAEWRMYQHDPAHTGYAVASKIDSANVSTLTESWRFQTGGWVTGTPIVAGGVVYVGSWDGRMYALKESDGSQLWSFDAGTINVPSNGCGDNFGIDSTGALVGGRLYFGSASCSVYSLDAQTGQQVWRAQLADPLEGFHLWSSPLVFDGKIYVGLGSHCGAVCVRGRVLCLDAATGQTLWTFYTAPEGSTGASVWASLAIDAARRTVFIATGNFCSGNDAHGDSILALNADTGALFWNYKNAERDRDDRNFDFGASPTLFNSGGVPALAVGSKDGSVYAVNRETGDLLWRANVVEGDIGRGIISSPAAAYGLIFTGAYDVDRGRLVALDQLNGEVVWEAILPAATNGATAIAGGVVFINAVDGFLRAFDASTGALLWSAERGPMYGGGISISKDHLFTGSSDGNVYAFSLPGVSPPPPPPTSTISIALNAPVGGEEWNKGKKYNIEWTVAGDVSRVNVNISRDGGATWALLAENLEASLGTIRVKAKKPRSDSVIVRVSDAANQNVFAQSGVIRIR